MRRRLFQVTTAVLLAVGVIVPTTALPAQAVDPKTVITVLKGAYDVISQFFGGGLTLEDATNQIKTAIANAQTQIIDEIDAVAAAQVRACAESAVINLADIENFTPDTLQSFALATTDCVTQADSLASTLTDKAAVDQVGFALNAVAPVAFLARARAGLSSAQLDSAVVSGENSLVTALLPACKMVLDNGAEPGTPKVYAWDCTAYNGDNGYVVIDKGDPNPRTSAENEATSNTSRAVAQAALLIGTPAGQITGYGGKCVDVAGANPANGTQIQLYTCNGTAAQKWSFGPDGTIHSLGKCMSVAGAGTADGTIVHLYDCNGTGAESWIKSGTQLINTNSGKCLDATGISSADGTPLQIWGCTGGANQQWNTP